MFKLCPTENEVQITMEQLSRSALLVAFFASISSLMSMTATGQTRPRAGAACVQDQKRIAGHVIRSIKLKGRAGNEAVESKLATMFVGKTFESRKAGVNKPGTLESISTQISTFSFNTEANKSFEKRAGIAGASSSGNTGVTYLQITPCVVADSASSMVDITVDVYFLRVDLKSIAKNILPVSRSLRPSFYDKMSPVLRVFDPQFDVSVDRKSGLEAAVDLSTNLADLPELWKGEELSNSKYRLDLRFAGRMAIPDAYYQIKTDLTASRVDFGRVFETINVGLSHYSSRQPLGTAKLEKNGLQIGVDVKLRPRLGLLNTVYTGVLYRKGGNRLTDPSRPNSNSDEETFAFRTILDGRLFKGFARAATWIERGDANHSGNLYTRVAGRFGYQREFGKNTQTIGLEVIVGAGRASDNVPPFARYFGGNESQNFLYDAPHTSTMVDMPKGPIIRAYGRNQAGVINNDTGIGGNSYWHTNFNLTIPISPWSRRLIPNEIIEDYDDNGNVIKRTPLNQILENFTIGTAVGGIGDDLFDSIKAELIKKDPTLSEDDADAQATILAQKKAKSIVNKEIAPTIKFLSRHANLFAVKPMIMFDAAGVGQTGLKNRTLYGVGGGVQFVLVIARAELGYMFLLPKIQGESRGNVVFRITFQNLY